MRTQTVLSEDQLRQAAPSIFAVEPWHGMSDRYAFIPTIDIVRKMANEGFMPFAAAQAVSRIEGKQAFTKHLLRFRDMRANAIAANREQLFPEIVLTNSHDGGSKYKLNAGIFRCVCINGLVAGDSFSEMSVRHTGKPDGIIDATFEIVNEFPKVLESVEAFQQLQLTAPQQTAFAEAALQLRYDDGAAPIAAAQVIRPKRIEDRDPSLWNTFNMAQEHLTQGGVRGRTVGTRRRLTTRPVTGISESTRLNKALWTLTERMRELVG